MFHWTERLQLFASLLDSRPHGGLHLRARAPAVNPCLPSRCVTDHASNFDDRCEPRWFNGIVDRQRHNVDNTRHCAFRTLVVNVDLDIGRVPVDYVRASLVDIPRDPLRGCS
jgi:hypothetical protein